MGVKIHLDKMSVQPRSAGVVKEQKIGDKKSVEFKFTLR